MIFKHSLITTIKDFISFKNIKLNRQSHFNNGSSVFSKMQFGVNEQAARLHPESFTLLKSDCSILNNGSTILTLSTNKTSIPIFKAGQHFNLLYNNHLYSFFPISTCKEAENGFLKLYIPSDTPEQLKKHVIKSNVGTEFMLSSPVGYFYYNPIRDGSSIVFVCDDSGLGAAISFDNEDNQPAEKTIYCITENQISDWLNIIKIENVDKIEIGNADSLFVCGKVSFCKSVTETNESLKIRRCYTDISTPDNFSSKSYLCTVYVNNERLLLQCHSDVPLIETLEESNIITWNKCLNHDCSFCRARLIAGSVYSAFPDQKDTRRLSDAQNGFIHPCVCYPTSDLILKY